MYADVNEENERMVDDFFNSKKPKAYIVDVNIEEDYVIIEDMNTKERLEVDKGLGMAKEFSLYDLPLFTCYDKEKKITVNP